MLSISQVSQVEAMQFLKLKNIRGKDLYFWSMRIQEDSRSKKAHWEDFTKHRITTTT